MNRSSLSRTVGRLLATVTVTLNLCGCALGSCGQEAAIPIPIQTDGPPAGCASLAACTPPLPDCAGTGAAAGTIAGPTDPHHIGGPGAAAMTGDFYLQNDKVRFVVQRPGRIFAPVPEGGNIIDADLVRSAGEPGDDELGELTGFLSGTVYTVLDRLEVMQDGAGGGPAVLQGDGVVDVLEYMNLPAILGDNKDFATLAPAMAAFADKLISNLRVRVTYALCPGESAVRIRYTLFNNSATNAADLKPSVGTFLAGAGESSAFMDGFGFGPRGAGEGFTQRRPGNVFGLLGKHVAYAQRPYQWYDAWLNPTGYWSDDCNETGNTCSSQVTVSGLTITAFGEGLPAAMLTPTSALHPMVLKSKTGSTFELLFGVGRDIADAQAAVTQDRGLGDVTGTVAATGALPAATHVAVFDDYDATDATQVKARRVVSSFNVAADGTYGGKLRPGAYVFELDAPGRARRDQRVTIAAGTPATADFTVDATRTITYNVTAAGQPTACRISVIGKAGDLNTGVRSNQHRDTLVDRFPAGLAYVEVSSVCDSTSTAPGAVGPLEVKPGKYRIVVSRGPELSILDQRDVDLTTTTTPAHVTGDLVRAMHTDGWAVIDLHQHAYLSFDSRLPHERRLTAYLAEGVDFFGASEHDHVYDYTDLIAQMGFEDRLATMTGSEISPMHYGHFNAFELIQDKDNPVNGGAPDWSGGADRTVVTPDVLLAMAITAGADLIEANHPRAPDGWTYLYWWDRCGLEVNLTTGTVGCRTDLQAVRNDLLDVAEGDTLWSDKWHLLEMFNRPTPICRRLGYDTRPGHETEVVAVSQAAACSADGAAIYWCDPDSPDAGRPFDAQVDAILMDWLNLLQVGFIRTVVGNSDSHKVVAEQAGLPRSYVLVGAGHDNASDPDLKSLLKAALLPAPTATPPRLAGAVVAGNGPFVTVTVVGQKGGTATSAGIGGLVEDDDGTVDVQVHIEAPDWMMGAGRIEIFANDSYPDNYTDTWVEAHSPSWRNDTKNVEPVLAPSDRTLELAAADWTVAGGRRFIDRTLTVTPAGPTERDAWIVVRVSGDKPMYPVLPDFSCFRPEDDPAHAGVEPFFGTTAMAVTNPVFVLQNGHTTWKAPAAP